MSESDGSMVKIAAFSTAIQEWVRYTVSQCHKPVDCQRQLRDFVISHGSIADVKKATSHRQNTTCEQMTKVDHVNCKILCA